MVKMKRALTICLSSACWLENYGLAAHYFGIKWVLPFSVRETSTKKCKKIWRQHPCAFFGQFGGEETELFLKRRSLQLKE